MNVEDWLLRLMLGFLLGVVGQFARAIVGLKKAHDSNAELNVKMSEWVDGKRLLVSIMIGGAAGSFAILALFDHLQGAISRETVMLLIAAGYSGADFIEGFMTKSAATLSAISPTGVVVPPTVHPPGVYPPAMGPESPPH